MSEYGSDCSEYGDEDFLYGFPCGPDYKNLALSRLIWQYQGDLRPVIQKIICIHAERMQRIDDVAGDVIIGRQLELAEGVYLDRIGERLGIPRPAGATDAQYRPLVETQVFMLRNRSNAVHAYQTIRRLFPSPSTIFYQEHYPIAFEFEVTNADLTFIQTKLAILSPLRPATYNFSFITSSSAGSGGLILSYTADNAGPFLGYTDPLVGGTLASVWKV